MKLTRQSVLAGATLVIGGLLGASALVAMAQVPGWNPPSQTPPNGNVAAPINVGGIAQQKDGWLGLSGGLVTAGLQVLTGEGTSTTNTSISTGGIAGKVLTAIDSNGTVGWRNSGVAGNYKVAPTWDTNIVCPTDGVFYDSGDNSHGKSGDFQYLCSGGKVTAIADGNYTPTGVSNPSGVANPTICSNGSWTFYDNQAGNDLTITCQSVNGYVLSMCNTNFTCPAAASTTYSPGQGIYCNWSGAHTEYGQGNDTVFQCESNHLYSINQVNQQTPSYIQLYTLVSQ